MEWVSPNTFAMKGRLMAGTVFDVLKKEHAEIKQLMQKAEKNPRQFSAFTTELNKHVQAEEQVVYQALKKEDAVHEKILEGYEEHHVVDLIIREMQRGTEGNEKWQAKFSVMSENLEHHIEEEEHKMFPTAERAIGRQRAMELAKEYQAAESQLVGAGRS